MNAPDRGLKDLYLANTHEVVNVSRELVDTNLYLQDAALQDAVQREGAAAGGSGLRYGYHRCHPSIGSHFFSGPGAPAASATGDLAYTIGVFDWIATWPETKSPIARSSAFILIWRLQPDGGVLSHTGLPVQVQESLLDEVGRLYLLTDLGIGLVHSADMNLAADNVETNRWRPGEVHSDALPARFGFVPHPQAAHMA